MKRIWVGVHLPCTDHILVFFLLKPQMRYLVRYLLIDRCLLVHAEDLFPSFAAPEHIT